jgi:hypothetical protein
MSVNLQVIMNFLSTNQWEIGPFLITKWLLSALKRYDSVQVSSPWNPCIAIPFIA